MKLIVGLGNPGAEYARTRHNVGFRVLDAYAQHRQIILNKAGFSSLYNKAGPLVLAKPLTFMNLSGEAVGGLAQFFKITPANTLIIYDDFQIPRGAALLRMSGSAGGHNGMQSVIASLGTSAIPRLRIGIGAPAQDATSYVLGAMSASEEAAFAALLPQLMLALDAFVAGDVERALRLTNTRAETTK